MIELSTSGIVIRYYNLILSHSLNEKFISTILLKLYKFFIKQAKIFINDIPTCNTIKNNIFS